MYIVLLIVFGIFGGVLGGMGMGGGTLLIPLLTLGLDISQHTAQAINLIAFLPMSIVAIAIHSKNKLINFKIAIPIVVAGIISSVFASIFANKVQSQNLSIWFGIFLIVVGALQILSLWVFNDKKKS